MILFWDLLQDLVKRGIPHHFRGIVWQLLCLAHDSPDKAKYADYIKATSACEKVIRRGGSSLVFFVDLV